MATTDDKVLTGAGVEKLSQLVKSAIAEGGGTEYTTKNGIQITEDDVIQNSFNPYDNLLLSIFFSSGLQGTGPIGGAKGETGIVSAPEKTSPSHCQTAFNQGFCDMNLPYYSTITKADAYAAGFRYALAVQDNISPYWDSGYQYPYALSEGQSGAITDPTKYRSGILLRATYLNQPCLVWVDKIAYRLLATIPSKIFYRDNQIGNAGLASASGSDLSTILKNIGTAITDAKALATTETPGTVIPDGTTITIDSNGVISSQGGGTEYTAGDGIEISSENVIKQGIPLQINPLYCLFTYASNFPNQSGNAVNTAEKAAEAIRTYGCFISDGYSNIKFVDIYAALGITMKYARYSKYFYANHSWNSVTVSIGDNTYIPQASFITYGASPAYEEFRVITNLDMLFQVGKFDNSTSGLSATTIRGAINELAAKETPIATTETPGTVIPDGTTITIDSNGVISSQGGGSVEIDNKTIVKNTTTGELETTIGGYWTTGEVDMGVIGTAASVDPSTPNYATVAEWYETYTSFYSYKTGESPKTATLIYDSSNDTYTFTLYPFNDTRELTLTITQSGITADMSGHWASYTCNIGAYGQGLVANPIDKRFIPLGNGLTTDNNGIALKPNFDSTATGLALTLGQTAYQKSFCVGDGSQLNGANQFVFRGEPAAYSEGVALGERSKIYNNNSIAIGYRAEAGSANGGATAIGTDAQARNPKNQYGAEDATAIGFYARAYSNHQTAIGGETGSTQGRITDDNGQFAIILSNGANKGLAFGATDKYMSGNLYVGCTNYTTTSSGLQTANCGGQKVFYGTLTSTDTAPTVEGAINWVYE